MKKIFNILFSELGNAYHQYLFVPTNRKKLSKLVLYMFLGFGCFLWGYKWRDAKIIIQNIQIKELSIKKQNLKTEIAQLQENLDEYNFMVSDGDYYRYLAYKHGDIMVPKETDPEDLKLITEQSKKYDIPFKYIYRLVYRESKYNPNAQSGAGARGYMQVMPATFNEMKSRYHQENDNIDELDRNKQNIIIGTYTLDYLHRKYDDWKLAFAAYNAGTGAVDKANGVPNITETQNYVKFILNK